MNRRNGNWLAPSINQLTATPVTVRAALSGYRSIKALVCAKGARPQRAWQIAQIVTHSRAARTPRRRQSGASAAPVHRPAYWRRDFGCETGEATDGAGILAIEPCRASSFSVTAEICSDSFFVSAF